MWANLVVQVKRIKYAENKGIMKQGNKGILIKLIYYRACIMHTTSTPFALIGDDKETEMIYKQVLLPLFHTVSSLQTMNLSIYSAPLFFCSLFIG